MNVYVYEKCSTCKSALDFLKERGVAFIQKDIKQGPPNRQELERMLNYQNGDLKKLFNTSGMLYKEMALKEKLKNLSSEEAYTLLHQHGMLVKRPFLLGENFGLLGFKEAEWLERFSKRAK